MSTPPLPQKSVSLRSFDDGLKLQVVRLVREQKLPAVQVCRDFNISSSSLHRWLNQYDAERRIRELERESQLLRQDMEILKQVFTGTAINIA